MKPSRLAAVIVFSFALSPGGAFTQDGNPWNGDPVAGLVGEWKGAGIVYGNEVQLTRTWSLDLAGRFMRVDMHVSMGSGGFRALAFWRRQDAGRYTITWMDELGDSKEMSAVADTTAKRVTLYYADKADVDDDDQEASSEWRRLVYEIESADTYRELMYRETSDGWEPIADFRFTRDP